MSANIESGTTRGAKPVLEAVGSPRATGSTRGADTTDAAAPADARPLVTIVLPAYNEAGVLVENVELILDHLRTLERRYRFDVLIVNDGSKDDTGRLAETLAARHDSVRVIHHPVNLGLGRAFQTAFDASRGDYVVTLDVDLSYSPDHIERLLEHIERRRAQLVLASPYMEGGRLTNVPWLRRTLSIWGNRFLKLFARGGLSTLTCMVRAYEGSFIRGLPLRATGMDIMPEVIYKTMILRGRIDEIPAHLDWTRQVTAGPPRRSSSMRIMGHVFSTVLSGFVFRPFMFLVLPGLMTLAFSAYVNFWMLLHFVSTAAELEPDHPGGRLTGAFAIAFAKFPHTFIVGLLSLLLAVTLLGLGALALQSKKYFEESVFLQMAVKRALTAASSNERRSA